MKTDLEKGLNTFMSDNSQDLLTMNTNYTETKMAGQNIIFCKKENAIQIGESEDHGKAFLRA